MVGPGQQNQSNRSGGGANTGGNSGGPRKSSRNKSRRRRSRNKKGRSNQKPTNKDTQQKVPFKPENLTPLGVDALPPKKIEAEKFKGLQKKKYGILVYDTVQAAEEDLSNISATAAKFDQLNIIIKAEAPRSHPELDKHGKLYCGEAWTLIHERRIEDGWYNEPQY